MKSEYEKFGDKIWCDFIVVDHQSYQDIMDIHNNV